MISALDAAMAALHGSLRGIAGVPGKYRRGISEVSCVFVPCETISQEYGNDGAIVTARTHDWKVEANEIQLEGNAIEPALDDLVVLDDGRTFAVVHGAGEKCWRWTDYTRTARRIHTVETAKVVE